MKCTGWKVDKIIATKFEELHKAQERFLQNELQSLK